MKKIIYSIINLIGSLVYSKKYVNKEYFERYKDLASKWVLTGILQQKIGRKNGNVPWPMSYKSTIVNPKNVEFCPEDIHIFQNPGLYIQANGKVIIGRGTIIGPNTGIVSANHNLNNFDIHDEPKDVVIGEHCWIGMNCSVLPGVHLGNHTIVGAGSVVTKSFPEGNCVIAGVPAKVIKKIDAYNE